jgi:cell division protease FtsH
MDNNSLYQLITQKKQQLIMVKETLNKEFIGLEIIIDELIDLLMPWFLFPDAQLRPTIINMWGLTGSGKTALVNRIIELLDYKRLYVQMDMGEFESDSATWIKNMFTDELEFFHEQPGVICFDEFQFARSINSEGNEIGKDKLRVIWDMLDSGKINYFPYQNSYYMIRAELCLLNLLKCGDKGVLIKNGIVVDKEKEFLDCFSEYYFENNKRFEQAVDKSYFLSQDFIEGIYYLFNDDYTSREKLKQRIEACDLDGLQRLILEGANTRNAVKQIDLSKSLIFVLGNLDEAYYMSNSLNPDISADDLYESTCKINITHIKNALKKRFRNEQIARLGNNHIIYRSFTSQNYRDIIAQKLIVLKDFVQEKFDFEILFDESVVDVVYSEGVYPAQGTRPVFTTVKNLIEGNISKIILEMIAVKISIKKVNWKYVNEYFIFDYLNELNQVVHEYKVKLNLKIGALRKSDNIQLQAHTAVHEAGHAILAALSLRIIPSLVVSKTAAANSEGFCVVNMPEGPLTLEVIKKDMIIGLGGYVAEKLIFGVENTCSGVSQDIEQVSELANRAIKEYAMGNDPIYIRFASTSEDYALLHQQTHTEEVLKLIRNSEKEAEEILSKNKMLLLKMSEYLTSNSRLEEKQILEMVCKYANEDWVCETAFVKKEDYFQFAKIIANQIAKV